MQEDLLILPIIQQDKTNVSSDDYSGKHFNTLDVEEASHKERARRERFKQPFDWYNAERTEQEDVAFFDFSPAAPSPDYIFFKRRQYLDNIISLLADQDLYLTNRYAFYNSTLDIMRAAKKEFMFVDSEAHLLDILDNAELTILKFSDKSSKLSDEIRKILFGFFKKIRSEKSISLHLDEALSEILFKKRLLVIPTAPFAE